MTPKPSRKQERERERYTHIYIYIYMYRMLDGVARTLRGLEGLLAAVTLEQSKAKRERERGIPLAPEQKQREREREKRGATNSEGESPLCNSVPQSEGAPKPATS